MNRFEVIPVRDLHGYGADRPKVRWPNGANVAVSLVINYEEGAEASLEDGQPLIDRDAELRSGLPDGVRDLAVEQMFAYGLRAGLWRVLDALDRHERKATFLFCGRAVERTPDLARAVVARGHEAACHGYRWACHALMSDREAERTEIHRAVDAIEQHLGTRPLGFYSRWAPSAASRQLLQQAGFLYDSNAYDDDLPYYDWSLSGGPMLVLPYALDSNDYKFFESDPWGTGRAFLDYLSSALEVLVDEGRRGAPKLFNVGLHLRIIGRPGRFWALERFLEELSRRGNEVWVATRLEIARHWLEHHPPMTVAAPARKASG
jgi:peptidoglycan/xylan/chitin deacetylase (PgdA/CDA1 family)